MLHPRAVPICLLIAAAGLAGCATPGGEGAIREFEIHIGYNDDRTKQYATPTEIKVKQGDKVRFTITNDDAPGAADSFHDIAFRYNGTTIEHEVPAGQTTKTCVPQAEPGTKCTEEKSAFVASEKGRFKMWCEVGPLGKTNADGTPQTRHEQMGMFAFLVVG